MNDPVNSPNMLGAMGSSDVSNADWYSLVFNTGTILAGGTSTTEVTLDGAGDFVVTHMLGTFWIVAALASSVINTPLPRDADPSSASNLMPNLSMVSVLISTRSWQWMNNSVRANQILCNGTNRNWFFVNPKIPARDTVSIASTNGAAVSIAGQYVFMGYRTH